MGNYNPTNIFLQMNEPQTKTKNTEHIFKYVAEAHPGINECPTCGIGYGLYEYRNTLTNEKVFSCHLCIKKLTKSEHLQKIIAFTTALVEKKIWLEQYINELDN